MQEDSAQPLIFVKQYGLVIGLFIAGLVFFIYGLMQFMQGPSSDDVTFHTQEESGVSKNPSPTDVVAEILVDIEGAVVRPGVYKLASSSRLQDVLAQAGGFNENVDREKVAKGLNLAEKLIDGAKIYIPFLGEETVASVGQQTPIKSGQTVLGLSSQMSGVININTASTEQLDSLPGVGAVTAGKIIANRPYASTEELVSKKAVGQATYEKLKEKITVR